MLLSYLRPSPITWTLAGAGAAWLTDADSLTNGRPAAPSRLQWLTGEQSTGSILTLRGTWATAVAPRVVGLVGLTLPPGTLITLAFRRAADAGYTYLADQASQRVVTLPDGSRCAWFVLEDGLDPVIGLEYRIANDVDGAASIAADSTFEIGEAWVAPAVDIPHEKDWKEYDTDPSTFRRSLGSQLFTAARRGFRGLQVPFARAKLAAVRGGGLANGMDWQQLRAAVRGGGRIVAITRYDTPVEVQRTTLFGTAKFDDIAHLTGPDYAAGIVVEEVPASAAT